METSDPLKSGIVALVRSMGRQRTAAYLRLLAQYLDPDPPKRGKGRPKRADVGPPLVSSYEAAGLKKSVAIGSDAQAIRREMKRREKLDAWAMQEIGKLIVAQMSRGQSVEHFERMARRELEFLGFLRGDKNSPE